MSSEKTWQVVVTIVNEARATRDPVIIALAKEAVNGWFDAIEDQLMKKIGLDAYYTDANRPSTLSFQSWWWAASQSWRAS